MTRTFNPATWMTCTLTGCLLAALPFATTWAEVCQKQIMTLPVMLEGAQAGDMNMKACGSRRTVDVQDFLYVLYQNMEEKAFHAVEKDILSRDKITWNVGDKLGELTLNYDEQDVALELEIPLQQRNANSLKLRGFSSDRFGPSDAAESADLSAYSNLYVAGGTSGGVGMMQGQMPLRVDTDIAVNVKGTVLEGSVNYVEGAGKPFMADNVRLVRDDPAKMVRYQAGELSYPITGFQNYKQMLGVGVARNFSLQPYRVTSPSGRANFTLQTPSTVDVYVNNQRVRTMQLARGTYELDDFPIVNGVNNVRLVITDAYGRTEERFFPIVNDADLLRAGLWEFAGNAGIPVERTGRAKAYDREDPLASGLVRYGVKDWLTVGANVQADRDVQMLGLEQTVAGTLGTLKGEFATSRREEDSGNAWRLEYRNLLMQDATAMGEDMGLWSVVLEHKDGGFHALDDLNETPYAYGMQVAYSRNLTETLTGTGGVGYKLGRDNGTGGSEDDRTAFAGLYWRALPGLAVNLNTTYSRQDQYNVLVGMSWFPLGKNHQVNASYDAQGKTTRVDGMQTTSSMGEALEMRAGVVTSEGQDSVAGAARYNGGRGFVRVSHDVVSTLDREGMEGGLGKQTQIQAGTALVYAGGAVAIAKPINNSFLILSPRASLDDVRMTINPMETPDHKTVYEAKSSVFGPAVLTDMMPYVYHKVQVGTKDNSEEETMMGQSMFTVKPTYKSGTRLKVGSDALAYATGAVVDETGLPVLLASGEIRPVTPMQDGVTEEAEGVQMIFTNRQGTFTTEALKPGRYVVTLSGYPHRRATLEIPAKTKGKISVGTLTLAEES